MIESLLECLFEKVSKYNINATIHSPNIKEKVRKRKKSGGKKVFPLVCLDTKRYRNERCEV